MAREVDRIADLALEPAGADAAGAGASVLATALDRAAAQVGSIPAVRRLARSEPGALGALLAADDGPGWQHARDRVAEVIGGAPDVAAVDLVLRWLASQLAAPAEAGLRARTAELLADAVMTARPSEAAQG